MKVLIIYISGPYYQILYMIVYLFLAGLSVIAQVDLELPKCWNCRHRP